MNIIRKFTYITLGILSGFFKKDYQVIVLCYHSINNDNWRFSIDLKEFEKQMTFLSKGYEFWNLYELLDYLDGRKKLDGNKAIITFDDGYLDILKTQSIVSKLRIKPTVFVVGNKNKINRKELETSRKVLAENDLVLLKSNGWTVGSHTSTHAYLKNLGINEIKQEVVNRGFDFIAYPKGGYTKSVLDMVKKSNYKLGLSMDDATISRKTSRLIIPRIGIDRTHSYTEFKQMTKVLPICFRQFVKQFIDSKFLRNLKLAYVRPIEFLWSFTFSSKKTVHIEPYNPKVTKVGYAIIKKIKKDLPGIHLDFTGSASLKIAGQKDIDIMIPYSYKKFNSILPKLIKVLGEPDKQRREFIEWHFVQNSCQVEIMLADPQNRVYKDTLNVYKMLSSNKNLLNRYEALKIDNNGSTSREYKRARLSFFNEIME